MVAATHLEPEKAQVLMRIWNGFTEPDSSDSQRPEQAEGSVEHRWAQHARGIRLLVEEMQHDTEVSAVLRADLAAALRSAAAALGQQSAGTSELDNAGEQQQARGYNYRTARQQASQF